MSAGTALVVLRVRGRHRARQQRSRNAVDLVERTLQDVGKRRGGSFAVASVLGPHALLRRRKRPSISSFTEMATCYRHPIARDGRVVLLVRASDLPRLHDPDLGRDALSGMRARAHARPAAALARPNPGGHPGADRDQRDRVPDRDGGRRAARRRGRRIGVESRLSVRPFDQHQPRVLAPGHRRLPARRAAAHLHQHDLAVVRRLGARAGDRARQLPRGVLRVPAGGIVRGPAGFSRRSQPWARPERSSGSLAH